MSAADKIAEAKALIPDAVKLAFETRALGHNAAEADRKLAFAYSERVQKVIDAFPPLVDLADAQAQENARLKAALEWYASDEAWTMRQLESGHGDYGKRAREALRAAP